MEQPRTVHYVTKDPIHNLKIKVTCFRISAERSKANVLQTELPKDEDGQVTAADDPAAAAAATDGAAQQAGEYAGQVLPDGTTAGLAGAYDPYNPAYPYTGPYGPYASGYDQYGSGQAPYDPYDPQQQQQYQQWLVEQQQRYDQEQQELQRQRQQQYEREQQQQHLGLLPPPYAQPTDPPLSGLDHLLAQKPFARGPQQHPHPVALAQQQANMDDLQRLEHERLYGTPGVFQDPFGALRGVPHKRYVEEMVYEEVVESGGQHGTGVPPPDRRSLLEQQQEREAEHDAYLSSLRAGRPRRGRPLGEALEDENDPFLLGQQQQGYRQQPPAYSQQQPPYGQQQQPQQQSYSQQQQPYMSAQQQQSYAPPQGVGYAQQQLPQSYTAAQATYETQSQGYGQQQQGYGQQLPPPQMAAFAPPQPDGTQQYSSQQGYAAQQSQQQAGYGQQQQPFDPYQATYQQQQQPSLAYDSQTGGYTAAAGRIPPPVPFAGQYNIPAGADTSVPFDQYQQQYYNPQYSPEQLQQQQYNPQQNNMDPAVQGQYAPPPPAPPPPSRLPAAPAAATAPLPPVKWPVERVFSWQEKVYSHKEVATAQAAVAAAAAEAPPPPPSGPVIPSWQQQSQPPGAPPGPPKSKRIVGFGSHQAGQTQTPVELGVAGSVLFSYIQTDKFVEEQEQSKRVTCSEYEQENHLLQTVLADPKSRAQVFNFRSMYIMVDLGNVETPAAETNEKVLVCLKAYPDGSFDMTPGFNKAGLKYRFEDVHGGIYEYRVENVSPTAALSLERRTAKLERAVAERADELRRDALRLDFQAPPVDHECQRFMLYADIQACTGYPRDRLYIEYVVRYDAELWDLQTEVPPQSEPGMLQGVTHVSRMTQYPSDVSRDVESHWVAHFAHPVEFEWVSRGPVRGTTSYPSLFFQVCTYDRYNRYTCEGYGWLPLGTFVPGVYTHRIKTWRPLARVRDKLQAFFIGGSPELSDITYLCTPSGFSGRVLNKYGFKTDSVGAIKVRTNVILQQFDPSVVPIRKRHAPHSARSTGAGKANKDRHDQRSGRKDLSLALVVERARMRLKDARGGDGVMVRPGVVSETPVVRVEPADAVAVTGETANFKIYATGLEPLVYQWYKDGEKIEAATADTPNLILVDVIPVQAGSYYCKVSNKDGSVESAPAMLHVQRQSRLALATGEHTRSPSGLRSPTASPTTVRSAALTAPRVSRRQRSTQAANDAAAGGAAPALAGRPAGVPPPTAAAGAVATAAPVAVLGGPRSGATATAGPAAGGGGTPGLQPLGPAGRSGGTQLAIVEEEEAQPFLAPERDPDAPPAPRLPAFAGDRGTTVVQQSSSATSELRELEVEQSDVLAAAEDALLLGGNSQDPRRPLPSSARGGGGGSREAGVREGPGSSGVPRALSREGSQGSEVRRGSGTGEARRDSGTGEARRDSGTGEARQGGSGDGLSRRESDSSSTASAKQRRRMPPI